MHIQSNARLSADAKAKWIAALPETSAGPAGINLCEALQDSATAVSVRYLEAFAEHGAPLALALVHTIHKMDLASYVGGVTQRIFTGVGALGWRPLRMDVTFVEVPFCNLPGMFFTVEGERREKEVVSAMIRFTRANLPSDIFCVKTYDHKPSEPTLAGLGMMSTAFPANTCLQLPFSTFDEYLKSLTQEHRGLLRANQRKFAAMNGRVTRLDDLEAAMSVTTDLFRVTESFHHAKGDLGRPLEMNADFLMCLDRNATPDSRFLLVAEVNGEPAAVMLVLRSGKQLMAVKAGLNYELAKPSRAYFNLYYAMIQWAIENRIEFIQMSAEAYDLKRRLGGTTAPVSYFFDVNNRWMGPVARLVSNHLSEQRGAGLDTRQ